MNCANCFDEKINIKLRFLYVVPCNTGDSAKYICPNCRAIFFFSANRNETRTNLQSGWGNSAPIAAV